MKCKIVAWSRRVLVDMQMVPSVHFGINIILWEQDEDATVLMRYSTSANLIWPMASFTAFFFFVSWKTLLLTFFIARLSLIWDHQAILGKLGQMRRLYCREIHQAYCATEGARCELIAADLVGLLHCWGETLHYKQVKRCTLCDPHVWWPWTE